MSTAAAPASRRGKYLLPVLGTGAAVCAGLQYQYGQGDDFFDFRFVTDKKPNDLAEFYGSEDFMEIFCIFPFVVEFMMKNGEFQADAVPGYDQTVNTFGFGGKGGMEVSMAFDEGEIDTTGDGKPDTIAYFNKRERFKDWAPFLPKYMEVVFWDLTQNFGYTQRADGTCEVYHHGETFYGPFPIRFIFTMHAAYVAWATKRYIQRPEFGDIDKADENHHDRRNIPKDVFNEFLDGLISGVEKTKAENESKGLNTAKQEETLKELKAATKNRKLKTYATVYSAGKDAAPHKVQVETDDPKVQAAIRAAMGSKDKEGGEALSRMLSASEVMMKDLKKQQELEANSSMPKGPEPLKKKIIRRQSSLLALEHIEGVAGKRAAAPGREAPKP